MKITVLFILVPILMCGQIQIGENIDGEETGDVSETSVSFSSDGNIVAIGAPHNNSENRRDSGHVRVYNNIGGTWTQVGENLGETAVDQSGHSVSLSGDGSIRYRRT